LRILGLDDFERGLVPGTKTPVGVSESGQRAPDRAVRHRERLEAERADAIERRRFHRAIADPAAQLVRGMRDPQVESRIAEGAGLLVDSHLSGCSGTAASAPTDARSKPAVAEPRAAAAGRAARASCRHPT